VASPLAISTDNLNRPLAADSTDLSRELEALVNRFEAFIRRTASHRGLIGADVDDVVQDLRIRIWKAAAAPGGIRSANAHYIYRTAVSATLDIIRLKRSRDARAVSLELVAPVALGAPGDVDDRLEAADLAQAVGQSLARLQPSRRVAVRMYLTGYDRFEIADITGWTEGKTRNLLYRGLEDLRSILAAQGITAGPPSHLRQSAGGTTAAPNCRHSLRTSGRPPWSSAVTRQRPWPSGNLAEAHGGS
jgi:RNA polymerase sigma-70 factor (ECF subfamily)